LRIYPKSQKELWEEGFDSEEQKYVGAKWGKYLRAPKIFFTILEKGKGKLVPLKQVAKVRFGIKTGANEFFYLTEEQIKKWKIEKEFWLHKDEKGQWVPNYIIKSPRECHSILVKPEDLKYRILMIHKDKKDLKGTNVLKYIEWGEKKGYHKRPTCAARERWYDLGVWEKPDFLWPDAYNDRFGVYDTQKMWGDKRFFYITLEDAQYANGILGFLNSSIIPMLIEIDGITNLGEGAVYTNVYQLKSISVPKVTGANKNKINTSLLALKSREALSVFEEFGATSSDFISLGKIKIERRRLDEIVMGDILGLTEEEQLAVYKAVIDLVKTRLERAKSLKKGKRTKDGLNLDLLVQNVLGRIGEDNLAIFYKDRIAAVPCYSFDLPKSEEPIKIENSLFGWRLKIGRKTIDCSSEAQARYLRVFAEMGCDQTLVPKDDAYLSSIVNQWESLFEKAQAALQEHTSSILQIRTRDLLIQTVWAKLREQMS
jgi:hypothetical protein